MASSPSGSARDVSQTIPETSESSFVAPWRIKDRPSSQIYETTSQIPDKILKAQFVDPQPQNLQQFSLVSEPQKQLYEHTSSQNVAPTKKLVEEKRPMTEAELKSKYKEKPMLIKSSSFDTATDKVKAIYCDSPDLDELVEANLEAALDSPTVIKQVSLPSSNRQAQATAVTCSATANRLSLSGSLPGGTVPMTTSRTSAFQPPVDLSTPRVPADEQQYQWRNVATVKHEQQKHPYQQYATPVSQIDRMQQQPLASFSQKDQQMVHQRKQQLTGENIRKPDTSNVMLGGRDRIANQSQLTRQSAVTSVEATSYGNQPYRTTHSAIFSPDSGPMYSHAPLTATTVIATVPIVTTSAVSSGITGSQIQASNEYVTCHLLNGNFHEIGKFFRSSVKYWGKCY